MCSSKSRIRFEAIDMCCLFCFSNKNTFRRRFCASWRRNFSFHAWNACARRLAVACLSHTRADFKRFPNSFRFLRLIQYKILGQSLTSAFKVRTSTTFPMNGHQLNGEALIVLPSLRIESRTPRVHLTRSTSRVLDSNGFHCEA